MEFRIPFNKGPEFSAQFFNLISDCIDELGSQTGKWPDQITFAGSLGKELMDLIESSGWNMDRFQLVQDPSVIDKLTVGYSKELDQVTSIGVDGKSTPDFSTESMHGQMMNGIPGPDTVARIQAHVLSSTFKMEKKIRPKVEVRLMRSVT
jgi:hypothetical protein